MFDKNQERAKSMSRIVLVFVVSVCFMWFTLSQAEQIQLDGKEVSRQATIQQVARAVAMYTAVTGHSPENPNFPYACRVGVTYDEDICLEEVFSEGYLDLASLELNVHAPVYWVSYSTEAPQHAVDEFLKKYVVFECMSEGKFTWCIAS